MSGQRTFLFAGGGTGGHIYPALAIAEHLTRSPSVRCVFLCSDRPLDAEILTREGVPFDIIPAKPFSVRPRAFIRFAASWGGAVRISRAIIARERAATVHIVAMGGFVAAPVVQAARVERCPITLVNLDAVPGKANRWIARHAARVFTAAPVDGAAWTRVPPIVRAGATAGRSAAECRRALGLDPDRATLLVTGASQGARSINRLLIRMVADRAPDFRNWQVIHQTGANEDAPVRDAYQAAQIRAVVRPFIVEMGLAWGAADLAVSRAGAGSVAEAWSNRVPTIFLPYPYHRDQHQRANARPLEEAGAAVIVQDRIEEAANAADAGAILARLMKDDSERNRIRDSLARLGPADGAARIAAALTK